MRRSNSFRFCDEKLQDQLLRLVKEMNLPISVGQRGDIRYPNRLVLLIENELISSLRYQMFPKWQIITCPRNWITRYRTYIFKHKVPCVEEVASGKVWFLVPGRFRPHQWKL